MSTFWLIASDGILELTSTSEVQINYPNTVTKHKMESGATATDHIINENMEVSFSGVISEIRRINFSPNDNADQKVVVGTQQDFQQSVQDYITMLEKIRDSKTLFSLFYDDRLPAADNCLLSNVRLIRDSSLGTSYKVSIDISQIRLSARAKTVELKKQTSPNDTGSLTSSGTKPTVKSEPPTVSVGVSTVRSFFPSFGDFGGDE